MEANEKNLLVGVLTKTLNKTDEEVSDLLYQKADDSDEVTLKEGALDLVLDADAQRVSNLKKSAKPDEKVLTDQYLKGKKEGKAELEAELRSAAGIETSAIGLDLVKEVVNHLSDCNIPTDEQIKAHPLYVALEKERVPKEDYNKLNTDFEEFKSNLDKTQRLSRIKNDVLSILPTFNPVISENQVVAQTRQQDFLQKFEGYEYELQEDGNHIIKRNGSRIEDPHGNPIKFKDFVKDVAALNYDFKVSDDVGNAGNRNTAATKAVGVPKTEKGYMAQMNALIVAGKKEESVALAKAWAESQNK